MINNVNSGAIKNVNFVKGTVLYYTSDKKHNNLLYLSSHYNYVQHTLTHVFENLDNQKVELMEKDFDVNYSVFIDL